MMQHKLGSRNWLIFRSTAGLRKKFKKKKKNGNSLSYEGTLESLGLFNQTEKNNYIPVLKCVTRTA